MKSMRLGLILASVVSMAGTTRLAAQDSGWWGSVIREQEEAILRGQGRGGRGAAQNNYPTYDPRSQGRGRGAKVKNGNGPPFCRNGQGHPTKGWQWCVDKGWANGAAPSWGWEQQGGWSDVIFRNPAPRQGGQVGNRSMGSILGDIVLGRLTRTGMDSGLSGPVDGRWLPLSNGGSVLQVRMGGYPLAELADLNRDGRADAVLLNVLR